MTDMMTMTLRLRLTAVNAKVLLQVMLVFEGFSTLAAFKLSVSSFFAERRLQREQSVGGAT